MKQRGTVLLGVLLSMILASSALAITSESPYSGIPVRNVFGLKPKPVVVETNATPAVSPVKIVLTGVTTILGRKMVLFKTQSTGRPGQAAAEASHIMTVGDSEAGIEVLEIDEVAGLIKFKNQDSVVTLSMEKDAAKLPNTPAPAAAVAGVPVVPAGPTTVNFTPQQTGAPGGHPNVNAGLTGIPSRNIRSSGNVGNMGNVGGNPYGYPPQPGATAQPFTPTPEEQLIMMEVERERNKNNPNFPPLPPTVLNPNNPGAQNVPPGPNTIPPIPR